MNSCLLVIPTYNEAEAVPALIDSVLSSTTDLDILIVDDNSPDGTGEICDQIARSNKRLSVLHRQEKKGLGAAYVAGFVWGLKKGYTRIAEMDADGSHSPSDLVRMLEKVREFPEIDLLIGSRWIEGGAVAQWTILRKILSKGANKYASYLLGSSIRDLTAGFRIYRATLLQKLNLNQIESEGYCFQIEMALKSAQAGANIFEVPITFLDRTKGESKMSFRIVLEAMFRVTVWGFSRHFAESKRD